MRMWECDQLKKHLQNALGGMTNLASLTIRVSPHPSRRRSSRNQTHLRSIFKKLSSSTLKELVLDPAQLSTFSEDDLQWIEGLGATVTSLGLLNWRPQFLRIPKPSAFPKLQTFEATGDAPAVFYHYPIRALHWRIGYLMPLESLQSSSAQCANMRSLKLSESYANRGEQLFELRAIFPRLRYLCIDRWGTPNVRTRFLSFQMFFQSILVAH